MLDLLVYIGLASACIVAVFVTPFVGNMQATTLWVGKKITPAGLEREAPRGFQDAITPGFQNTLNVLSPASYVVVLVLGSIAFWYLGVLLLVCSFLVSIFVKKLYPNRINFYLRILIHQMSNRTANYTRDGDTMRADAAEEMTEKLMEFYEEVKDLELRVPTMKEASSARLGRAG